MEWWWGVGVLEVGSRGVEREDGGGEERES